MLYLKSIASTSLLVIWYFAIAKQIILYKVLETSVCVCVHPHDIFISSFSLLNIEIYLNMLIITIVMKMLEILIL